MKTAEYMVTLAHQWIGRNEADGSHKHIIDIYNSQKKLPRGYKVKYTDSWCATFISALAIQLKYTSIIPVECSCVQMIRIAKSMKIWKESDIYSAKRGDIILYDWQDSGYGDNQGVPDHIGLVTSVDKVKQQYVIIEGNYDNQVKKRYVKFNAKGIRGFIVPEYDSEPSKPQKSNEEIAKEVIAGKWGNGSERELNLKQAGYDYATIQKVVNVLIKHSEPKKKRVTKALAKEVIAGKWGNGSERQKKLEQAGYDYEKVQRLVNELVKG